VSAAVQDGYAGLGSFLDIMTREQLRERCCELTLYLYAGVDAPNLVDEVEELARDSWALRDAAGGDN
jgi:hypothetical protein